MRLGDLWLDRMSWRELSSYVRNLPSNSALHKSMLAARPQQEVKKSSFAVDPLEAMEIGSTEYIGGLLLAVLNRLDLSMWARAEKKWQAANPFVETLPPGFSRLVGASPGQASDAALNAYLEAMKRQQDSDGG